MFSLINSPQLRLRKHVIHLKKKAIVTAFTKYCPRLVDIISNNVFFSFTSHINIDGKMLLKCSLLLNFGNTLLPLHKDLVSKQKHKELSIFLRDSRQVV